MAIAYPLFVFEKDDKSIRLIEDSAGILGQLDAIDIENGEYVFWDANGDAVAIRVSVGAFASKVKHLTTHVADFPLRDALAQYAESLDLTADVKLGTPMEIWNRIQSKLASRTGRD